MNVFNRAYLKLGLVSILFTLSFCFSCNLMIEYILNSNIKLVCDVYYEQISEKIKDDISLLKSANEYLTENEIIIDYLKNTDQNEDNINLKRQQVLFEIIDIEKILDTISFVDSINIV
ncbi:MAG: hypothetical protein K2L15_00695, partial [Eubacteriales bacterium]|nr:hypothetical protein [Eubacteriales bacterium]